MRPYQLLSGHPNVVSHITIRTTYIDFDCNGIAWVAFNVLVLDILNLEDVKPGRVLSRANSVVFYRRDFSTKGPILDHPHSVGATYQ